MNQDRITHLVHKLRKGEASQQEIDELNEYWQWAQADQSLFESIPQNERDLMCSSMFNEIQNRIEAHEEKQQTLAIQSWIPRIAAVFALVAISFVLWRSGDNEIELATAYGEQKNITLPDGSSIILNGNSAVKFSNDWDENSDREIWLNGEGFLEVVHTANHNKFTVHTEESLDVQVLGTRFNVKVRRGRSEVMLEEGRVRLSMNENGNTDTLTMKPGELVTCVLQQVQKTRVDASHYASWKDNKLYFNETPLFEVADILEDAYGFQVEFKDDSLNNRKLSGEIQSTKAEDILSAIRESMDVKIIEDGRKIIFYSK